MGGSKQTRRRPAEVRQLIVDAAGEVFREKGYSDATTEEIGERAGVSGSVMYRYFPTKSELFRASALHPFVAFLSQFREVWQSTFDQEWTDLALMREFIGDLFEHLTTHRDTLVGLLSAEGRLDPGAISELQATFAEMFAEFGTWGAAISDRRKWISPDDFELTFRLLLGMVSGSVAFERWYLDSGSGAYSRDHVVDHMSSLMLYGLRLKPTEADD